ncbi:MAG: DUF1080 domain-containing protein [Pirellulaceae bacterium]|nr:DUF1080 domain-containing protein [Pirellulaceae bacterium]
MTRFITLAFVIVAICVPVNANTQAAEAEDGWICLFDGKSLDGWKQLGGEAKYTVEDGEIVGTSVPNTSNSFLRTEKMYGDFILELEFKVHPELNSGIQIRSHSLPDYRNGRVHGYQVEIDASDRGWSGGIYDESRRGWLNSLEQNAAARYAFKQNQWNHFRIQAIGDSIKTWLNGVPAADLVDSMTQTGFIALQVHGVGDREDPVWVRWRNIRIKDLGTSTWKPLFDGKSLDGWAALPGGQWTVDDGVIRGTSPASEGRHGMLLSNEQFRDFTARIVYRANRGNSGFYFRVDRVDGPVAVHGFQAEIDAANDAGGLYETGGRAWVAQPSAELVKRCFKPGEWNEMTVSAHGRRIVVQVNGTKTADLANDPGRLEGFFGLQLHGGQEMDVEFKSIELLESEADRTADDVEPADESTADTPVVPEGAEVKKLADGFRFTEGPAQGPDGKIYFSDIPNEHINIFDPESGEVTVFREESGKANGLIFAPSGALYACEGGARRLTRQFDDEITVLAEDYEGKRLNSPNDLVMDGKGGIYFTDPRYGNRDDMEMEVEGVYFLPRRDKLARVIDDLVRPNGLILSLDNRTLYVADNGAKTIWAYDVQPDGTLAGGRKVAEMDLDAPGGGDGMTIDQRGNIYCAGQGHIWIWDPQGKVLAKIATPEGPANCTFGGPDGKTLYITARQGFYCVQLNVAGGR